jgi:hypothetical protein
VAFHRAVLRSFPALLTSALWFAVWFGVAAFAVRLLVDAQG